MKQLNIFIVLFLCLPFLVFSQNNSIKTNGVFYKISAATTLAVNEYYEFGNNNDEPLFVPNSLFVNNTIGYQFDERAAIGLNFEYDWHSQLGLHFFPVYLNFQYNIIPNEDDIFIRGGYGTLVNMGKSFQKGNMYKLGAGYRIYDDNFKNSFLIGLDFTRKQFGYRTLEGLSSVSIFIEFMLF